MMLRLLLLQVCLICASAYNITVDLSQFDSASSGGLLEVAVAIGDVYLVVGQSGDVTTGQALVFEASSANAADWPLDRAPILLEGSEYSFGTAVATEDLVIAVSAPDEIIALASSRGAVHMYSYVLGTWELSETLADQGGVGSGWVGYGTSVEVHGQYVAVGAPDYDPTASGAVFIYRESSLLAADWLLDEQIVYWPDFAVDNNARFGYSLSFNNDVYLASAVLVVGARFADNTHTTAGKICILTQVGSFVPACFGSTPYGNSAYFGTSVGLDGDTLVAGAPNPSFVFDMGAAFIFTESSPGTGDWTQRQFLEEPDNTNGYYGFDCDVGGNSVVVSSPSADSFYGNVFMYTRSTIGALDWIDNRQILIAQLPDSDSNFFGRSVAYGGAGQLVVGAENLNFVGAWVNPCELGYVWDAVAVSCIEIDECWSNPCENGGACSDAFLAFSCDCTGTNAIGDTCSNVCVSPAVDVAGTTCDCAGTNAVGDTCNKPCNNGVPDETYTNCDCTLSGATGKYCTNDVDDCESSPCANNGACTDFGTDLWPLHNNEYNCTCDPDLPYMGTNCEDTLCYSSPCLNSGTCVNGEDFVCNCTDTGYLGDFCETEVDECSSSPCLNDGDCTDLMADFSCNCAGTGYEGATCSIDVDDCLSSPCQNDGSCQDKGANKFKCTCDEFWEGDTCTDDVDDCILRGYYCQNGGACADNPNLMGDVLCTCIVELGGFTGRYCEVPIEDACVTFNPCRNGGKCIVNDITKAMSCDCTDTGYDGDVCDVQVFFSECVSSPCLNGGQCYDPSDQDDDWYCNCDDTNGYFGDICGLTACDSMPCQNEGTCTPALGGDYTCTCPENYSGAQCQVDENEQVGAGSSSSSSSAGPNGGQQDTSDGNGSGSTENDGTVVIIIVVVVVVVVLAATMFFIVKQRRSNKEEFVMPT